MKMVTQSTRHMVPLVTISDHNPSTICLATYVLSCRINEYENEWLELIMMKEGRDSSGGVPRRYASRCPIMLMNINVPLGVAAINAGHSGGGSRNSLLETGLAGTRGVLAMEQLENKRRSSAGGQFFLFSLRPFTLRAQLLRSFCFRCDDQRRPRMAPRGGGPHKRIIKIK